MNFLPEENKIAIKKEYLRRLFMVASFFIFSSILIGIILLSSTFLLLKGQKEDLERQLSLSQQRLAKSEAKDTVNIVQELNKKISILENGQKNISEKSAIIKNIISRKPEKITISGFLFDKNKISIQGFSDRRDNMLNFINSLKQEKSFKKVESPISNLLKEKDIEFSISIEL
jgi:Tfp pilus assembly protein PilN